MGHASLDNLNKMIGEVKNRIPIGGIYYHYKSPNQYYVVESIAILEEVEKLCVVYRALYGKGIVWVRTVENFLETTDNGPRFVKVE